MSYDIILGRDSSDKEVFGDSGLIFLGRGYVKMGNRTSLSNKIWMDVARSHAVLIAGKRGSGKSYTLAAIAEELSSLPPENAKNISSLIFDTMGIFWTMKYKNEKDSLLLKSWNLEPKNLPVKIFIPYGKINEYQKNSIPFDYLFSINAGELEPEDWINLFNLSITSQIGVLISRIISETKEKNSEITIKDIQSSIMQDKHSSQDAKDISLSLFIAADTWGIFSQADQSAKILNLIIPGATSVLDISTYSSLNSFNVRALVISLVTRKLFESRLKARKKEEIESIRRGQDYLSYSPSRKEPLIWIFIDEAHEFLPQNEKTPATDALIQIIREGRQPGISLVLATQQPGKIHRDVLTQSDIIIAHRVTSKQDIESLNEIMQTYLIENIKQHMESLPSLKGSAIILDDNSERIYPIQVRPRFTWHGGETPASIKSKVKL